MRHSIKLALAACAILACGPPSVSRSTATVTTAAEPTRASSAATGVPRAPDASTPEGPPPPPWRCHLRVTESQGCEPRDVEALIAPARPTIENCRGRTGGKLLIRVRDTAGKLAFDLEPGTTLDPTEKQCVLDALTTIHGDESATAWMGLNVRPTGFTSLITIEW